LFGHELGGKKGTLCPACRGQNKPARLSRGKKLVTWMKVLCAFAVVSLAAASPSQAAEIKVLSGNGPKAAVRELCAQFEKVTGNTIDLRFGVNVDVKKKIEAGERFDVVIGNPPIIDALIMEGAVIGPRADIGRSGLGVAVRAGEAKPDIATVDLFKRALLAAKAVAYPGRGASGIYFVSLLDRLGIKGEMQGKLKPMEAEDTVEVVARGEADMVVVVATRISDVAGVEFVGIPEELQTKIGFAAGLATSAKDSESAKALIRFLTAPAAAMTLRAKGVDPI
jgi:molybdate transport system substrate-binding protein